MLRPEDSFQIRRRNPKTNAERQRDFRERNPDYYRILQAKRRAPIKAMKAQRELMKRFVFEAQNVPLMLPAPVETIEIPGVTILGMTTPAVNVAVAVAR